MRDMERLIEAVEAGTLAEAVFHGASAIRGHWAYTTGLDARQRTDVFLAYNGSLDAAKALHEALLPGWDFALGRGTAKVFPCDDTLDIHGKYGAAGGTARAWLLAILRAKAAQE